MMDESRFLEHFKVLDAVANKAALIDERSVNNSTDIKLIREQIAIFFEHLKTIENLVTTTAVLNERSLVSIIDLKSLREALNVLSDFALSSSASSDRIEKSLMSHILTEADSRQKLYIFAMITIGSSITAALLTFLK